ncbi:hypothetical protein YC2023_064597 [Brassica napus]
MYFPLIDLNDSRIHWFRPHVESSKERYNVPDAHVRAQKLCQGSFCVFYGVCFEYLFIFCEGFFDLSAAKK